MKSLALILTLLFSQEIRIPKNNPDGVWGAATGSQFEMQLSGSDLHVKLVPGSNPRFLQYELDLKNEKEVNTYSGKGFFVAKMETGKECKLSTEWRFVVVSNDRIVGTATNVTADGQTCAVQETTQIPLDLTRKKK
jgi:hypothetical protein